jgi:hypothetical protein
LRHADEHAACLLTGVDRKRPTCAQNAEIDPFSDMGAPVSFVFFAQRQESTYCHTVTLNRSVWCARRSACAIQQPACE